MEGASFALYTFFFHYISFLAFDRFIVMFFPLLLLLLFFGCYGSPTPESMYNVVDMLNVGHQ